MITFLTLFLGLVSGPQEVRLRVASDEVARIEILIDGELRASLERASLEGASLEGEPWTATVDFGPGLDARRLVAVAYDASGTELERAEQGLNRPWREAEIEVVLERQGTGAPKAALVNWQSVTGRDPQSVRATLDGDDLVVDTPDRIPLPPIDLDRLHILEVELDFGGGIKAGSSISFGGASAGFADTELTALLARTDKPGRDLRQPATESWVTSGSEAASIVAIESGGADVVLVKGDGVGQAIRGLERGARNSLGSSAASGPDGMIAISGVSVGATATWSEQLRRALTLADDRVVRLILPHAAPVDDRHLALQLFPASPPLASDDGGLIWALTQDIRLPGTTPESRVADAVAIAGMQAAASNRRRAVVLILAQAQADASRYRPAQVRDLLGALDVPLVVWQFGETVHEGWEGARIDDHTDLRRAVKELERDLDRQRILWLAGRHEPDTLRLTEAARQAGLERVR
jgi:hypothetical protein